MSDKKVLAAFLAATVAVAAGSALAASDTSGSAGQSAVQKDFGKLSADGARAYQDLTLTRLAIYDAKGADNAKGDENTKPATDPATAKPIAWLPVDGAISLDEDYRVSPEKTKAVADANKSIAQGDRKGAMDKLKLADVNTSVVLEVVPLDQTISDVHQAAQLIDGGKYYEGSQMLRKVQMSARYDVADYLATPKGAPAANAAPVPAHKS